MSDALDDDARYGRNFIRERRKQLDLSQEKVADEMGVSSMTISRWENEGVLTVQDLSRLADVLKCAPAQLVPQLPRTYVLSPEEEALLLQFRSVETSDRRSITTLARALHDSKPAELELRKPTAK